MFSNYEARSNRGRFNKVLAVGTGLVMASGMFGSAHANTNRNLITVLPSKADPNAEKPSNIPRHAARLEAPKQQTPRKKYKELNKLITRKILAEFDRSEGQKNPRATTEKIIVDKNTKDVIFSVRNPVESSRGKTGISSYFFSTSLKLGKNNMPDLNSVYATTVQTIEYPTYSRDASPYDPINDGYTTYESMIIDNNILGEMTSNTTFADSEGRLRFAYSDSSPVHFTNDRFAQTKREVTKIMNASAHDEAAPRTPVPDYARLLTPFE